MGLSPALFHDPPPPTLASCTNRQGHRRPPPPSLLPRPAPTACAPAATAPACEVGQTSLCAATDPSPLSRQVLCLRTSPPLCMETAVMSQFGPGAYLDVEYSGPAYTWVSPPPLSLAHTLTQFPKDGHRHIPHQLSRGPDGSVRPGCSLGPRNHPFSRHDRARPRYVIPAADPVLCFRPLRGP